MEGPVLGRRRRREGPSTPRFALRSGWRSELAKGADKQGDYLFNKKRLHHRFCTTCGIESYAEGTGPDGSPSVGINLRCLEGVDVDKLSPRAWDGRSK